MNIYTCAKLETSTFSLILKLIPNVRIYLFFSKFNYFGIVYSIEEKSELKDIVCEWLV